MTFEPVLSKLLHGGHAPNARDAKMLALLDAWHQHGGSRLDRTDPSGIGNITDPGAAIMDTAWPLLANAWASSVLGPKLIATSWRRSSASTTCRRAGSTPAGTSTWTRTCARSRHEGARQVQRALLRRRQHQALPDAAVERDRQGRQRSSPPSRARTRRRGAHRRRASGSRSCPGLLPFTMRYTNRPTGIQQVVSFSGHSAAGHRTLRHRSVRDRRARDRADPSDHSARHKRRDDPQASHEQRDGRGREQPELPRLVQRGRERDRRAEDRADRRRVRRRRGSAGRASCRAGGRNGALRSARTERRQERDERGEHAAADAVRRVADRGDRCDDRARA